MDQPNESLVADPHSPSIARPISSESGRTCLACGYDLQGLGDEPRCPECGLLNIPEGFRRQVWELVDSGKWLFSSFFGVFRKRPPGWWWSLDRSCDLRKAIGFAIRNFLVAAVLILLMGGLNSMLICETTTTTIIAISPAADRQSVDAQVLHVDRTFREVSKAMGLSPDPMSTTYHYESKRFARGQVPTPTTNRRISFERSNLLLEPSLKLICLVVSIWTFPACVGIWTQIRKSLPKFARAPRTILAASFLETHRMIHVSLVASGLLILDMVLRSRGYGANPFMVYDLVLYGVPCLTATFASMGWIAPLRSDYTRQLIRSRWHAARIFLMYALFFPVVLTYAIFSFVHALKILRNYGP